LKKLFWGSNLVQKCGPSYKKRRQSVNIYDLSNAADLMVNSILLQVSRSLDPVNYSGSRVISPFPSAFPIEESEKSCSDSDQSGGRYSLANQNNNNSSTDLSERRRFF